VFAGQRFLARTGHACVLVDDPMHTTIHARRLSVKQVRLPGQRVEMPLMGRDLRFGTSDSALP
jgi:hypothetical protein